MFDPNVLSGFSGSEQWYRHPFGGLIYTDGIAYLANNGAGWLLDAIASYQGSKKLVGPLNDFQLWELRVRKNKAVLTCKADSDQKPVITQRIPFTDFPMEHITLYVERGEHLTLMLPSER